MDAFITRYCFSLLLLTSIRSTAGNNETTENEPREARVSGRIVKLYSGVKPEPYLCSGEGFQPDPSNCAVFYRCVKERSGKFTVFRYQCAPGTVYDPDVEICNHPRSTRRAECGGMLKPTAEPIQTSNINEIDGAQSEVPRPISTKVPVYTEQTTLRNPSTLSWILSTERQSIPTKMPWGSTINNTPSTLDEIQHETTISGITAGYLWSSSTDHQLQTSAPKTTRRSDLQYSDPCTSDGFIGDSENCRKFYRCVGNQRGGYVKYEFSCSESTVWDDEIQGCNHPWAVKRSKCGRSMSHNDKYSSQKPGTNFAKESAKKEIINNEGFEYKSNETIQQQLQISHGSQVTQTQIQISNSDQVIQNQTQFNYGDKVENFKNSKSKQNQTQISHETAVSQTQTQIDYGNKGVQTQLQIDHSKDSSQSQVQIQESTTQSATSVQNHNAGNNECSESGFMGDANNCTKFYRCVENGKGRYIKFQYFCGDGTVWDPEIKACNHAWAVKNCGGKIPPKATSEASTTTRKSTEFHAEPTKTTESYYTTSQVPDIDDEDDVGYGNPNNQETVSSVTTMKPTTITTLNPSTTKTTEKSNAATIDCTSSGFIGDAYDCKIFYRCVDNARGGFTKFEFKCGDGTLWDPDIEACNHAWAVKNCGGSTSGNVDKEETTTKKVNTTYPLNLQTTVTLIEVTTQASTQNDDYDTGYGSQSHESATNISSTKQPQAQESGKNSECKSSGFLGDEIDCKKFYRCVDNGNRGYIRYEFACGQGTVWDPKIEACNHAWAVEKCGGSNNLTENIETTSQSIPSTSYVDSSSAQTTQGYKDTDGPIETMTTSTVSSATTSSSTSNKCSRSGFMGDNRDCKKFYRCVDNGDGNYIRYEFTCGEGTVWDPNIEACNHAWAVEKCGGSNNLTENIETTSQSIPSTSYVVSSSAHTTPGHKYTDGPIETMSTISSAMTSSSTRNKCSKSGFMGDSSDCKKFYRCVDNGDGTYIRYEFTCGDGTVWDSKIEACNHAWAVEKCGGGSELTHVTRPTTSQNPVMQDEEQENGYATPNFETSELSHMTTSTISSSSTSITAGEIDSCNKEGFMSDKNDCKKFYRCVDNGNGGYDRYEFQCGEGTVWVGSIESCNHVWAVKDCGAIGSSTTHVVQYESTTQSISSSVAHTDGQIQQSTEKITTTTQSDVGGDECTQEEFFGNKKKCKIFYRCVNNGKGGFIKYEFSCGEGTSWNQEIQGCDHADPDRPCGVTSQEPNYLNDDLDGQTTSTTETTSSIENNENTQATVKPQTTQDSCESEGFYENPSDCKKFYRCVANSNGGYIKYNFNCGDGTVWNQNIQACDHQSADKICTGNFTTQNQGTASQSESTTSSYSTTKIQETTNKTKSPEAVGSICTSDGFFSHPHDCKKFIRCVNNDKGGYTKYEFSCGDGTIWVQDIQACDHDNDVNSCSAQSESMSKPQTTEAYSSDSSVASSTQSMTPSREDDEYDTGTSQDETAGCTSDGYFANKQDCKKFYRCVDNGNGGYTKYDFVCGDGTAWDPNLQTCNHINEVLSCSGSSNDGNGNHQTTTNKNQVETENTSSTTKGTTSSLESSGGSSSNSQDTCETEGFFGDSKDCTKFYRCVDNGKGSYTKYDFTCGDGTIWDQDITNCNHPQDVSNSSCSSDQGTSEYSSTTSLTTSSSSQTTSSTSEINSSSQGSPDCSQESSKKPANVTCDKAGYYANPNDCKKFYRCVDWDGDGKKFSVFHFECGEGTIWDPALDTCNHEDSVYPQRDCQTQSQTVGGETSTTGGTTTSTLTTESLINEQTTTQQPITSEETTTQQSTTSEQTTTEQSTNEQTTTQQSTTSEQSTTQEPTTSEQSTTQQSTTSEKTTIKESAITEQTTTQQSTTSEQTTSQQSTTSEQTTTEQSTNEQTTTQQSTTSEITTTQESTTSEETTTQQPTTSKQTTTEEYTTSEQSTTQPSTISENTTTEQSTNEQTTQQSTTSETTTTQESSTSEQTTTQQLTTNVQTTSQESATSEQTTTQQSTTSEQTHTTTQPSTINENTTTEQSTNEQTTTQQYTTSEKTTTQEQTTSEETTTQQSTTSEQTITQESTTSEPTTTQQSSEQTTEESTITTEQTTENITTTEESTNESTIHTSSTESDSIEDQSTTETSATTEEVASSGNCPQIEDDQYLLVCPTSFKRHPKYCNMFYQCTEADETYEAKVAMFECPNNTIYDESQTQCVIEDKSDKKCDGEIADKRRFKSLGFNYKNSILADKGKQSCSTVGYFSFEMNSECSKGFLKCEKSKNGQIKGLVYQCPDGYVFWSISKRCERAENVRDCKRSSNDWTGRWNIPVERKNIAAS